MSSLEELKQQLQKKFNKLKLEQEELFEDLNGLMSQKNYVDEKIKGLSKIIPTIKVVKHQAEDLVHTVNDVSESSEKISGKIRALDVARSRVEECQQRVSDLIDLEHCSQGVQTAIYQEEYEKGAAHVHRFLSMDQSLLQKTATDVENVSSILKSIRTLKDAAGQLRAIVKHKFDDAVKSEDLTSIERFFKIFPLLGMHEEGIHEFCNYLRTKIETTAEKNINAALNIPASDKRYNIAFADVLTLLFEGLARVVDVHQPLIETYYGPGHLLSAISILQKECDVQTKRILLEFNKIRQVDKKVSQIMELQRMTTSSFSKLDKIDPKDVDILIGEIAIMHSRMELYIKFIRRKVLNDVEVGVSNETEKQKIMDKLEKLIKDSDLCQSKHNLLSQYLRLEQYFMEESVAKAVNLDMVEAGQHTSSMVDDTFFIIKKCIRRAISTCSLDGICAIINNACRVLESDFCAILRSRLKQGYPSGYLDLTYNVLQTSIQQGRLQSGDTEVSRTAFLVAVNNADVSMEYVDALCDNILKEIEQALPSMTPNEKGKLESCLSGLSSATANLKEIIDYGMQQLHVGAVKPRISPWVDAFLNISHHLTEDELSAYEAGESFVQTLIMNLDSLLASFKDTLTPSNFDKFVGVLTTEVTARLEKVIFKTTFNKLGGIVLDKEVRSLAGYLAATTSWSMRDKFARLTQIATVLSLDHVSEITDYWGDHDSALTWRLTPTELRSVMALRTDFKVEDIRRIKL